MRGLLLAALVEAGLITWRDLSKDKILPLPSDYNAVAIFYGGLALLPESADTFTTLLAWGMVIATFFGLFDPANPTKLIFPGGAQAPASQAVLKQTAPLTTVPANSNIPGFNSIGNPISTNRGAVPQ